METLEDTDDVKHTGLSSSDKQLVDEVVQIGGDKVDTNSMMISILSEQLSLYRNNLSHTDRCKALDILKSMIETSSMAVSTGSENTAYRHFAKPLDHLFKGTQLKVLELVCLMASPEILSRL
ncbi:uncharacterized protein EV154DRAFT_287444 [Mucor mucedo]|uniref:uncharacterized protein n=1 Tax=Mucor mucedo TaxID=29922 RepID=UPI00222112D9|nr:uncharacterized protein EV154DRAFT_287444 [Mucor mucedo]KAI7889195.1 hypothetical protein EV154DRAFT_287444 [Mucor mucedo]